MDEGKDEIASFCDKQLEPCLKNRVQKSLGAETFKLSQQLHDASKKKNQEKCAVSLHLNRRVTKGFLFHTGIGLFKDQPRRRLHLYYMGLCFFSVSRPSTTPLMCFLYFRTAQSKEGMMSRIACTCIYYYLFTICNS